MQKVSEVYKELYHYTTLNGLMGILKTQAMWATNYKYLNDPSEIILFRDILISWIHPHAFDCFEKLNEQSLHNKQIIRENGGVDQVAKNEVEAFVDAAYYALGDKIFILSFCGQHENSNVNNNGLLSQWRGYGIGGGVALVFNTKKLEEMIALELEKFEYNPIHLSYLIYSDEESKLEKELSEERSIIEDNFKQYFDPANINRKNKVDASKAYDPFVYCISRYKHYGFSEENEVRVVALPTLLDQESLKLATEKGFTFKPEKEIKVRHKNGQLIPYIELFNCIGFDLPIERIIVGPHKEKEARAAALRMMLRNTKIEITCSDIPFIG